MLGDLAGCVVSHDGDHLVGGLEDLVAIGSVQHGILVVVIAVGEIPERLAEYAEHIQRIRGAHRLDIALHMPSHPR